MEHHDGHGVHFPALLGGLGSHSKALGGDEGEEVRESFPPPCTQTPAPESAGATPATHQRDVGHGEHHHALVLGRVLRDAAQARLQDVVAVEEGLLRARLHPHLVLQKKPGASEGAGKGA